MSLLTWMFEPCQAVNAKNMIYGEGLRQHGITLPVMGLNTKVSHVEGQSCLCHRAAIKLRTLKLGRTSPVGNTPCMWSHITARRNRHHLHHATCQGQLDPCTWHPLALLYVTLPSADFNRYPFAVIIQNHISWLF